MAMDNFKFGNMNKFFLLLTLVCCISSCQEKKIKIVKKTKEMEEKFDIVKYNKEIEYKEKLNDINSDLSYYQEKKEDGTKFEYSKLLSDGKILYSKHIYPPPPALYFEAYEYDDKGLFLSKDTWFFGGYLGYDDIKVGKSYYVNDDNTVTEVDEDEKYNNIKIKPNVLFDKLQKEPLFVSVSEEEKLHFAKLLQTDSKNINIEKLCKVMQRRFLYEPQTDEGRKNIAVRLEGNKTWFIMKDLYPLGQIFLEMDANTGKIYKREYKSETRP